MTFHDRQLNSMTFQAWKLKYLNSMTRTNPVIVHVLTDLLSPAVAVTLCQIKFA